FHIRMVNLLTDSPGVQYSIDSTVITSVGYTSVASLNGGHPGDHTVTFGTLPPASLVSTDPTTAVAIGGTFSQNFAQGRDYTLFAYGTINNPKTFLMDEASGKPTPDNDFVEYQFVDAAPNMAAVDVYVTAPQGQITSAQKVTTLNFGAKSDTTKLKLF